MNCIEFLGRIVEVVDRSIIRVNYFNYSKGASPSTQRKRRNTRDLCVHTHTGADFPSGDVTRENWKFAWQRGRATKRQYCKPGTRESQAATMSSKVERNPG